jgi:hypothetical protein
VLERAEVATLAVVYLGRVSHFHIDPVVEKHARDLEGKIHSHNWQREGSEERVVDHRRDLGLVCVCPHIESALPAGLGCDEESRWGAELVSYVSVSDRLVLRYVIRGRAIILFLALRICNCSATALVRVGGVSELTQAAHRDCMFYYKPFCEFR